MRAKYLNDALAATKTELPPHVYRAAELAYKGATKKDANGKYKGQGIIISGESGSGKTFTTKMMLKCVPTRVVGIFLPCHAYASFPGGALRICLCSCPPPPTYTHYPWCLPSSAVAVAMLPLGCPETAGPSRMGGTCGSRGARAGT